MTEFLRPRERADGDPHETTLSRQPVGLGRVMEVRSGNDMAVPVEVIASGGPDDEQHFFLVILRELGANEGADRELEQLERMRAIGQLAVGIAHDFDNLLTVIIGNLQLIKESPHEVDRTALAEALEAANIGEHLVDRLLAFGEQRPPSSEEVDVVTLVTDFADFARRALRDDVSFSVGVKGEVGTVLLEPVQLRSALLNLVLNARDAMPDGGCLKIELAEIDAGDRDGSAAGDLPPGRFVSICVSDTGVGMTPEVRRKALEPFFTTKPPGAGSGLGLSMVHGFVTRSGGHLRIESDVGRGSTVCMFLPVSGTGPAPATEKNAD